MSTQVAATYPTFPSFFILLEGGALFAQRWISPLAGLGPAIHGVPSMFNSLEVQVLYPS
jgi:hypothetical protein